MFELHSDDYCAVQHLVATCDGGSSRATRWGNTGPALAIGPQVLQERNSLHLLKGIIIPEGVTNFANTGTTPQDFDTVPVLIMNGDYRPTGFARAGNRDFIDQLNASPTRSVSPATYVDLDDPALGGRFLGTTHMMMVGTNASDVFNFALEWEENIPNSIVQTFCPSGPPDHAGPPQGVRVSHKTGRELLGAPASAGAPI